MSADARDAGEIRPYRSEDREAVREICRKTAYRGLGSRAAWEDDELFADYWTRYYTDYEPESALVAIEAGRPIGYLLGCADSRRHLRIMSRSIVPITLARTLWRWGTGRYKQECSKRFIRWALGKSWRESLRVPLAEFPAHYHCNVLAEGQGKCYYSRMALAFLDRLDALGVTGIHGYLHEPAERSVFLHILRGFLKERPGALLHFEEKPTAFGRDVLGDGRKMATRCYGFHVADYRDLMQWTARRYRM
ncbi:MAG: hypothetical protein BWZ10_00243 [candidate division BRC1 bacterium ADurb.BinA364]|nr:MAG: hypothetical protein BWZ10_00243 [candidate division BRC1 bacterium ADurb.BinA364]